jgi:hypothetical protein
LTEKAALERQMRGWQALLGPEREVILRQEHSPAQLGLSDFTDATRLGITSSLGRRLFGGRNNLSAATSHH